MWVASSLFLTVLMQRRVSLARLLTLLGQTEGGKGGGCSMRPQGTLPILAF